MLLRNGPTTLGMNYVLDTAFRGSAKNALWWLGFISSSGYTGIAQDDTLDSHPGWTESAIMAAGGTDRPGWNPSAASGGLIQGGGTLLVRASGTIKGVFLASEEVIGNPGLLYCHTVSLTARSVSAGGFLNVTYGLKMVPRS